MAPRFREGDKKKSTSVTGKIAAITGKSPCIIAYRMTATLNKIGPLFLADVSFRLAFDLGQVTFLSHIVISPQL